MNFKQKKHSVPRSVFRFALNYATIQLLFRVLFVFVVLVHFLVS